MFNMDIIEERSISEESRNLYSDKRLKKKVLSRVIYNSSRGPILQNEDKSKLRESIWLPDDKIKITFDFLVYDDKVFIQSMKEGHWGLVIENQDMADSFKQMFDLLWLSFAGKIQNVVRSL
jgi:hypothetical protein